MKLPVSIALAALSLEAAGAFQAQRGRPSATTHLFGKQQHQFNGGYDASEVVSSAKWTPREASEFVIWHMSQDYEQVGRQLTPLIQNWTGQELGEFLSRLYLGETTDDFEIAFESHNVRSPQWKGLDTPEGLLALKDLLRTALPDGLLEEPIEMAHVAQVFLWKEHTWPVSKEAELEKDSFASLGYTPVLVNLWMELREERGGKRNFLYSSQDVLEMVGPTPSSKEWGAIQLRGMQEFFVHMGIRLAPSCKVELVQGMASSGWNPGKIAKLVSTIPEVPEHEKKVPVQEEEIEEDTEAQKPVLFQVPRATVPPPPEEEIEEENEVQKPVFRVPPPPLEKGHLDNVSSYTEFIQEARDAALDDNDGEGVDGQIELPAEVPVADHPDILEDVVMNPPKADVLDTVRKKIQASKKTVDWQ